MTIAQEKWERSQCWFSDQERLDLQQVSTGSSDNPRGFNIDESLLSLNLQAKVRFHFAGGAAPFPVRRMRAAGW